MKRLKEIWTSVRGWTFWRAITAVRVAGLILGLVGIGIGVWAYRTAHPGEFHWEIFAQDYGANISTTLVGFTLAVLIIDALNEGRAARKYKQDIIRQLGSPVNDAAIEALRLAKVEGWDKNGALRGAYLPSANLQGADLSMADLQGAHLLNANLQRANLVMANLRGAYLVRSNLQGADLGMANLQSASMGVSKLQGVNFIEANLKWVDLSHSRRPGGEQFDDNTMLPDGTKWVPNADMARFTFPDHPNFWRSDDQFSPAYRGKKDPD